MTTNPQKQFDERIERLLEERSYSLPGWRVAVRKVRTTARFNLRLYLKEWLMYPLFRGPRRV